MAGDSPSDQFEYLFDPIVGDATTEAPVATAEVSEPSPRRRRRSLLLLAGATVVGAVVGQLLIGVWPERVEAVPTLDVPVSRTSTPPATPSEPVEPSLEPSSLEPGPPPPAVTPKLSPPAAPPQAPPSSTVREPTPRQAPGPSLRPPMSVSPEPRPAFPNQPGGGGNDTGSGGLLGGGLPGPLVYRP